MIAETTRKVDLSHLSFYRAWLQGMDLRDAANRYLGQETDLREAKTALAWIREALVRAARRQGKLGYARLLRIQIPNQARDGQAEARAESKTIPSFEEFYAQRNAGGFYSEAELLALYSAEYPDARAESPKEKRIKRLIERQIEAINWAANFLATAPMPSDSVVEWFDEPMAVRFIMTEIRTLGDLCERIRAKGYRWWGGIRQLGEVQGTRIVKWLAQHEATLGPLGAQAMSPVRAGADKITREPETGIVPIESFALPSVLDGSSGSNRALAKSRIPAQNDHQAIMAWLAARASNENTRRSYRREAERLLLWAILERGQALSSLDIEGGTEYRDWLAALGRTPPEAWRWRIPQERWIGKRNIPRWSPEWRPFDGALSLSSQRQAYTILKSMFEWLVKVRYLDSNPLDGVPPPQRVMGVATAPDLELTHAFTRSQWAFLMEYLHGQPMDESIRRLRFVLPFAYATGLRLAELVDARLGRLYSVPLKSGLGVRWMLKVLGKGGKWRAVPMPGMVMDSLRNYLSSRGLNADPLDNPEDIPMIARLRLGQDTGTLDPTTLYKALKTFFREAAAELAAQGHHDDAKKMAQASTHWLRHTRGAHSAETMPVNMIQRLLGHASVATTSIYTSTDDETLFLLLDDSLKIETQHGNRSAEWP